MFFLVVVVQLSDVLQYVWGKTIGRRPIAPSLSPNKTWEGFIGGITCATLLGTALWWATPYSPLAAAGMSLLATLMGFCGGLIMSAIKRDRGVKDYGALIGGHGGVLDRIDSLCFSAPIVVPSHALLLQRLGERRSQPRPSHGGTEERRGHGENQLACRGLPLPGRRPSADGRGVEEPRIRIARVQSDSYPRPLGPSPALRAARWRGRVRVTQLQRPEICLPVATPAGRRRRGTETADAIAPSISATRVCRFWAHADRA